ncbi:hypothetical protein O181_077260 [Austropuccinia psidii MF-1]|uniref:Integrase catalytic domain-containing protein n=1 Tax=Austropuccinia psidii MF-1 TaxID=1389203 RepID=A0A9Q3FHM8_9BASI|nr:hypothetical protein [Austropuccinia psidii MF-1]
MSKSKQRCRKLILNDDPNPRTKIPMGNSSYGLGISLISRSYNTCPVLVDRYSKPPIFLPCHKDDKAMDTAIMICNKFISHTGLFQNIISDRDPKFTSALWTNLHNFFVTKLSFQNAYHPQTDSIAERMIQTLEDMIRRFSSFGLDFKDSDGFTYDLCTLI